MKTITYSFKRLIPILVCSLALSLTGYSQNEPDMNSGNGSYDASMDSSAAPCTDPDSDVTYYVTDHTRGNYPHSVWVNGFGCQNGPAANFSFGDGDYKGYAYTRLSNGNFVITGTAYLSSFEGGNSSNNNCDASAYLNSVWSVDFEFRPAEDSDAIVPKSENGYNDDGSWTYYVIVRGNLTRLDGGDQDPVDSIDFEDMPNNNYGLQVGEGANVKNDGLGASTWLDYTATIGGTTYESGNKHADININLDEFDCPPINEPTGCYATMAVDYKPVNVGNIADDRQDPTRALGEPDRSNAAGGFVSLGGNGGELTLKFDGVVYDREGPDLKVWETTFSGDNCAGANDERARIDVSKNGTDWHTVGTICRDGNSDPELDLAGMPYNFIRYIRITDVTNGPGNGGDGYDVDGVEALNGCDEDPGEEPDDRCENYKAFYAHNGSGNASSVIYGVNFMGGVAEMTEIFDFDGFMNGSYRVHISYNPALNLIYAARNNGSELVTLSFNPVSSKWEEQNTVALTGIQGSGIVQNVFNTMDGQVYLGSASQNALYKVNPLNGNATRIDFTGLNISGGDLVIKDGRVFSASRSGRNIYALDFDAGTAEAINDGHNMTPAQVNGIALTAAGEFIMANDGSTDFTVLDDEGKAGATFEARLAGEEDAFTLLDGDLASGCADGASEPNEPCDNFKAFYVDHNGGPSTIYSVDLDDDNNSASLTEITTLTYQAHIALNTDDGYIYAVNEDSKKIERINPNGGTVEGEINLDPNGPAINSIYAMAYGNGMIYLGSANLDQVYEVDPGTGNYTVLATGIPVQGGDLVMRRGGLFLATRAGSKIYSVTPGDNTEMFVGDIAPKVNGLALNASSKFITTHYNKNEIYRYNEDGSEDGTYSTDGFSFKNGDLASGCTDADPDPLCDVQNFDNPGAEEAQQAIDANLPDFNNGWEQYSANNEPDWLGWKTTTSIEVQETNRIDGNASFCGKFHFELLSRAEGDNMYQVVSTQPGTTLYLSFYHKKRRNNDIVNVMDVLSGAEADFNPEDHSDGTTYGLMVKETIERVWEDGWTLVKLQIEPTSDSTVIMLRGQSGSTVSVGNLIDNVYIGCEDNVMACDDDNEEEEALEAHPDAYDHELISADDISIYPVPAVSNLTIDIDNEGAPVEGTYYITSMNGRTSHQGLVNISGGFNNTIQQDVSSLPQGIYFLVMEVNGVKVTKRFMKTSR